MNQRKKGPGLALQLGGAAALVAAVVGVLSFTRSEPESPSANAPEGPSALAPAAPVPTTPERPKSRWLVGARELLPPDAWVVAEVTGKLVWGRPFATPAGEKSLGALCESMPAPDRVAIAVAAKAKVPTAASSGGAPGATPREDFDIILAAPRVTDDFFACALAKIAQHGGKQPESAQGYTVVESRSGIIVHSPEGHLWFSSNVHDLERGLGLLRGQLPSAESEGTHAALSARLRGTRDPNETLGLVTFDVPPRSILDLNPNLPSELARVERAGLVAFVDGGALGTVECEAAACPDLETSLALLARYGAGLLPLDLRARTERALRFQVVPGSESSQVLMTWTPNEMRITELLDFLSSRLGGGETGTEPAPRGQ